MLTLTAPVGQAVLRSAIRLSDNFIKFREVAVFDPGASGCYDCLHAGSDLCANCPNKVYHKEMKKIYVNEKARYGERMTLSRNAILVFVYLHFLSPDENGFIRMVNVQEAAEFLHRQRRRPRLLTSYKGDISRPGRAVHDQLPASRSAKHPFLRRWPGAR